MEDKMAAGALGRATNDGWDSPFNFSPLLQPSNRNRSSLNIRIDFTLAPYNYL